MKKNKEAIFKTIIYADIFDYPLTSEELYRFLIEMRKRHSGNPAKGGGIQNPDSGQARMTREILKQVQDDDSIKTDGKYFFLKNRKKIVELRKKRERWSKEKLKIAQKAASWLKLIPWIKMVGITGSLAMSNSGKEDDIDFLIVSRTHRLWLTRFLVTMIIEFLGKRRRATRHPELISGSVFKDKICLNMYLDEDHLQVPKKEQDLFTAHEVVQVKLLWERGEIYNKFLTENLWVKKYLPNAIKRKEKIEKSKKTNKKEKIFLPFLILICHFSLLIFNFSFWEKLFKQFQLWYMRKRRTTEVISDGVIRFHPQDARKWVLGKYNRKLSRLNVVG